MGFYHTKISTTDEIFCKVCQHGKLNRPPFKRNIQERALRPGEVVHMDICGKMTHSPIGGSYYFLLFKDECTSYRIAYFIKHKSDAFSKFLQFQNLSKKQICITILSSSDNVWSGDFSPSTVLFPQSTKASLSYHASLEKDRLVIVQRLSSIF